MCGITGLISSAEIDAQIVKRMNDALIHRGPDGEGFMCAQGVQHAEGLPGLIPFSPCLERQVVLAHRRLAIVDLSALGHQPMVLKNRYVITYNGEIYNHLELRVELEKLGYQFVSHSDTEVILAAYDAWGADCLNKFNGMWSFVIVDTQKMRVFIARDRFAIKPLYYYQGAGIFVFASEIKALLQQPEVDAEPDRNFCLDYIKKGATVAGERTIFKGIKRFPAASFVECSLREVCAEPLRTKVYWSVSPNLSAEPFAEVMAEELARKYYTLLEDAVRLRLRADVKVGSALSGGLDSSSIVYLINRLLGDQIAAEKQETFSCVYKSPGTEDNDESYFIDHMADALGVSSNQIEPQADAIPSEHEKLIYAMDYPPENTLMSSWHTFKRVGQTDVTVTLDGQGADEQLGGYLYYLACWFAQMPLSQIVGEFCRFIVIPGAPRFILYGFVLRMTSWFLGRSLVLKMVRLFGYMHDPFIPLNEKLTSDFQTSLQVLLHYADRTSMAYSIESRMPFMDYRLVEFLAAVPATYKLHGGWTKYLARRAFSGKLPDEIVWRKDKLGWPIPEAHWFNGKLKSWLLQRVNNPAFMNWLGADMPIEKLEKMPVSQRIRWLNLAVWHGLFVDRVAGEKPSLGGINKWKC